MQLKAVQKECLNLLIKFDSFCKDNRLSYFLFYGTLLGAVRHKGFIPWDDDIDIIMSQNDFLRFIKLNSTKNIFEIHKLDLNNKNILFQTGWITLKNKNQGFIDVFVLMPVKKNGFKTKMLISYRYLLFYIHNIQNNLDLFKRQNNWLKRVAYYLAKPIRFLFKVLHIFQIISLFKSFNEKDFLYSNEKYYLVAQKKPNYFLINKSDIYPLKEMLFENKKYPIPKEYHKLLSKIYGDYMTPPKPKDRVPLHLKN